MSPSNNGQNRSSQTEEKYFKTFHRLAQKFEESTDRHWSDDPQDFVRFLSRKRKDWTQSTFYFFRSACRFVLEEKNAPIESISLLESLSSDQCKDSSNQTSGSRSKRFSKSNLSKCLRILSDDNGDIAQTLKRWLVVGVMTGIRPKEAQDIEYIHRSQNPDQLKIKNLKTGKVNDDNPYLREYRYLNLDNLNKRQTDILREFIEYIDRADSFDRRYNSCRHRLYRINDTLFNEAEPSRTLKSTRHQFAANVKARSDENRRTIYIKLAAMLGHQSVKTPEHYGYKRDGDSSNAPPSTREMVESAHSDVEPSEDDLEMARERFYGRPTDLDSCYGSPDDSVHPTSN